MAYATEDSGSLQKTGSASLLGSRVSPSRSLRSGRPTRNRFGSSNNFTTPANRPAARRRPGLDTPLTAGPSILMPP